MPHSNTTVGLNIWFLNILLTLWDVLLLDVWTSVQCTLGATKSPEAKLLFSNHRCLTSILGITWGQQSLKSSLARLIAGAELCAASHPAGPAPSNSPLTWQSADASISWGRPNSCWLGRHDSWFCHEGHCGWSCHVAHCNCSCHVARYSCSCYVVRDSCHMVYDSFYACHVVRCSCQESSRDLWWM